MAVEFISKGTWAWNTAAISLNVPSGYQEGDLLLCFVESANEAVTIPSGWTECPSSPIGNGTAGAAGAVRLTMFYKFASSSESAVTVADSGNHTTGLMTCWRGVDSTTPFNASANGVSADSASKSFPSVTTTVSNAMIINAIGLDNDSNSTNVVYSWANANLESITELHDQTTATGAGGGFAIAYGIKATAGSIGNTTATAAIRVDVYITLALTPYVAPSNDKTIDGSISQSSTVVSSYIKKSIPICQIYQWSSTVVEYTKNRKFVAEISQGSTVVSALTKQEDGATDYDLSASISQGSTVSAQNTKAINLVGGISQGQTVVAENKKSIYILAQVGQGSTVVSHVVKYEPSYDYDLTAEIGQSSEVVANLKKQSSLLGQVTQSSDVGASLTKQASIVGQVAQDESVVAQASKHIQVIASISQGSTVYSFITKEELEKTISASVEQQSSVVASVSKQINITAYIEQISVVLARISRGSTTRLIHPIRLTSSFKGGVRHGMIMPEPLGSVTQLKGAIKSQTRFNQPIRKELKF